MTPQRQTKFRDTHGMGNCLSACLASMLDMPIDQVIDTASPDMQAKSSCDWQDAVDTWLKDHGYKRIIVGSSNQLAQLGYVIACGISPRDIAHAVIYKDGQLAWDPHYSDEGIKSVDYYYFILPLSEAEKKLHAAQKGIKP